MILINLEHGLTSKFIDQQSAIIELHKLDAAITKPIDIDTRWGGAGVGGNNQRGS
jgi:hypothetical protein